MLAGTLVTKNEIGNICGVGVGKVANSKKVKAPSESCQTGQTYSIHSLGQLFQNPVGPLFIRLSQVFNLLDDRFQDFMSFHLFGQTGVYFLRRHVAPFFGRLKFNPLRFKPFHQVGISIPNCWQFVERRLTVFLSLSPVLKSSLLHSQDFRRFGFRQHGVRFVVVFRHRFTPLSIPLRSPSSALTQPSRISEREPLCGVPGFR